ncbi:LacI family DNA-binding transcriptional regulator [Devosia sediminis]|uniref:LacI family DNA-binding transcriptional regulator n=1 Tax=Devosia sediminis TaxID=2798801 RepID=A0A934J0Y4_9HYPH|nr:LacI family DNA-binding transcriptional regulator [Devosia sediminis]MBJ3786926.1 LacI family DNA-binding transcriptional regulator [Devosia sediminis]
MTKKQQTAARSADVARLAGVSRSAVSRTFTEGAYVSDETRRKVLEAARMLNYSPNAIARSLSKRATGLVGIIAADLYNPVHAQMLEAMSRSLQARGFGIVLLVPDTSNFDEFIPRLLSYQVDAVITTVATLDTHLPLAAVQTGRPVVMMQQILGANVLNSVSSDDYGGGHAAGTLLCETGHRRIAYISGRSDTANNRDRERGLRDALAAHGLAVYAQANGLFTHEGAMTATRQLLSLSPRPDAIFCANDLMALAALQVSRGEFGMAVPDDLAIVGYDNSAPSMWSWPALTSVGPDMAEMVSLTVDMVVRKIATGDATVEHQVVPVRMVERQTTRERPTA